MFLLLLEYAAGPTSGINAAGLAGSINTNKCHTTTDNKRSIRHKKIVAMPRVDCVTG